VSLKHLTFPVLALAMSFSARVDAQAELTIDSPRVHLSDVSQDFDGEIARLDLGPAPPPGNTRTLPRAEVEEELRAAGEDTKKLHMPRNVVIRSASRRWSGEELKALLEPSLSAALPHGIRVRQLKYSRALLTSPKITVGDVHLPKIPKHEGELTLTATVDLRQDDVVVLRVPVTLIVDVSVEATRPALSRGSRVSVVIEHGGARVSAVALAMSDAELGDVTLFRVASTQRVLRARLETPETARVVEP
jgi:Chaperone for flagella basal body P-ring formation